MAEINTLNFSSAEAKCSIEKMANIIIKVKGCSNFRVDSVVVKYRAAHAESRCKTKKNRLVAPSEGKTPNKAESGDNRMDMFGFVLTTRDVWFLGICGTLTLTWIVFRLNDALNRRNERNVSADKMFINLSSERNSISPMWSIQRIDFELFKRKLPFWKLRSFSKCVENYYRSKKENYRKHANGSVYFQDTTSIAKAIDELIKFTDRK